MSEGVNPISIEQEHLKHQLAQQDEHPLISRLKHPLNLLFLAGLLTSSSPVLTDPHHSPSANIALAAPVTIEPPQPQPQPQLTISEAKPAASPTPDALEKEVSNMNFGEYLLSSLVQRITAERQRRYNTEPGYADRIDSDLVNAPTINLVLFGSDSTRDRLDEFNNRELNNIDGNLDGIMIISYNIKTQKFMMLSVPRDYGRNGQKINGLDPSAAVLELEELTGIPIDGELKINIDSIKGSRAHDEVGELPGALDELFPDGAEVTILKDIFDDRYPGVDYKYEEPFTIKAGKQKLKGDMLVKAMRSRTYGSDHERAKQQLQILMDLGGSILPEIFKQWAFGSNERLDRVIQVLKDQRDKYHNLSFDMDLNGQKIDLIDILEEMKAKVADLRNHPGVLTKLGFNTLSNFDPGNFVAHYRYTHEENSDLIDDPNNLYMFLAKNKEAPRKRAKELMIEANRATNIVDFAKGKAGELGDRLKGPLQAASAKLDQAA